MVELSHLSYSSISAYQLCPLAWRFRYVDRIKTPTSPNLAFGSAFHETLERLISTVESEGQPAPALMWAEHWKKATEQEINWDDERPEELGNLGTRMLSHPEAVKMIQKLIVALEWEDGGPLIEKRVELRVPGVPIPVIGYIDMLGTDSTPYDFKTAGKAWTIEQAQKEAQPTYYLAALNQMGYTVNPQGRFRHIVWVKGKMPKVQEFETRRTATDMLRLITTIQQIWQSIEAEAFTPVTTGWKHSKKFCDYWDHCPSGGKE